MDQSPPPAKSYETAPNEGGNDLPQNLWLKIRSVLLGIDANGPARRDIQARLNEAYHVFARTLSAAGEPLSNSLLHEAIPPRVFQWAVARKWLTYPPQRKRVSRPAIVPGKYASSCEPVPGDELTVPFGVYMMTDKYKSWILSQLELAIAQWEAARAEFETRTAKLPERSGGNKSAKSTFWRLRREEFEALPPGEYSLIWSSHPPKSLDGQLLPSQWSWLRFSDGSLRARVSATALKCAKALGRDSEDGWFDELREADFVEFKLTGRALEKQPDGSMVDSEFGSLEDIVKHSITLCHVLEAEAHGRVSESKVTVAESALNGASKKAFASADEMHGEENHSARAEAEAGETAGDGHADPNRDDSVARERADLITAYKVRGRQQGIRISDEMIAMAANPGKWNERTMVIWWKRNDPRCKLPHDKKIRAVLEKDPSSIWQPNRNRKPK